MRDKDDKLRLVKQILVDGEDVSTVVGKQVPSTPRSNVRDAERVCPATDGRSRQVKKTTKEKIV